jgi:hypothetical protein
MYLVAAINQLKTERLITVRVEEQSHMLRIGHSGEFPDGEKNSVYLHEDNTFRSTSRPVLPYSSKKITGREIRHIKAVVKSISHWQKETS